MPRSGRERDGVMLQDFGDHAQVSPALVGRGQESSPPVPMTPPASGTLSTMSRMVRARRVPAARREPAEQGLLRRLAVEMEGLRIEFAREGLDGFRVDALRSRFEALSDSQVLEKKALHGRLP